MNWTRGKTIGHGSTATVSAATVRDGEGGVEIMAVKSIELAKSEFLQREQKILSVLSSPYIVGYKGYDISTENNKLMFNLLMEYLPAGTVTDVVRNFRSRGRIKEGMISSYTRQIVQGLEYLHSNGIVHCDIKGSNILASETGAKIADFGCAKWVFPVGYSDQEITNSAGLIGGTPLFMAPEVARGEEQGFAADIWALGCTIIEMATGGSPPWINATNAASLIYRIGFTEELPKIPDFLSDQGKDFLEKCLRRDPNHRWTAEQLLKHPFIVEEISEDIFSKQSDQEFKTSSPTSILDQGIWNSVEEESKTVSGIKINDNNTRNSSINYSPAQRLSKLSSSESRNPNWNWDENWITVRSRENAKDAEEEEMAVGSSLVGSADSRGTEVDTSTADENSSQFPFCKNINLKNIISYNNNNKNKNRNNSNFRRCKDEIHVIRNLNFEWQLIEPIDIL